MPALERPDGTVIHYDVRGSGPPVLQLGPVVIHSRAGGWHCAGIDPIATLENEFTVITMDQRNTGESTGPNAPFSWDDAAEDQAAVLRDAGVSRALVVGEGICANHGLHLIHRDSGHVQAAVLIRPLARATAGMSPFYGLFEKTMRLARTDGTRGVVDSARFNRSFDANPAAGPWAARLGSDDDFAAETIRKGRERYIARVVRFRDAMFPTGTPWFSVPEGFVNACPVPLLVVPGGNEQSPRSMARRLVEEAPRGLLCEAVGKELLGVIRAFLHEHAHA